MANPKHLKLLQQGVVGWNAWREKNRSIRPNLIDANLRDANLVGANLNNANLYNANLISASVARATLGKADLSHADLRWADLSWADLSEATPTHTIFRDADCRGANFSKANLWAANFIDANLSRANFSGAMLPGAYLGRANLSQANLSEAILSGASFIEANLRSANLVDANLHRADLNRAILAGACLARANLSETNLSGANFNGANLSNANLSRALLVETDLGDATLDGCVVYGVSAWGVTVSAATKQEGLIITPDLSSAVTVDDLEVAQFVYLLLHNDKIRRVIDTITSKVVLILGRFSIPERKAVLDALRTELRKPEHGYVPVVFDFDKPASRTADETITLLARMARFVIADLSDAKSVLQELRAIVPDNPMLPVQPLIVAEQDEPGMFDFFKHYPWFLEVHRYSALTQLTQELDQLIAPVAEAAARRRR